MKTEVTQATMTPEEIFKRLSSEKFVGNIIAMARSERPDNPVHQRQYDAAKAIDDLHNAGDRESAAELLEAYVLAYGQDPDCY